MHLCGCEREREQASMHTISALHRKRSNEEQLGNRVIVSYEIKHRNMKSS